MNPDKEQFDVDYATIEILEKLLGVTYEVKLHAEKVCIEKDYKLR